MLSLFPPLKYINVPNTVTLLSICLSFISLVLIYNQNIHVALIIYPLAHYIDGLDGFIARKLGQSSKFGEELDSFADGFSFSIIPVMMALILGFNTWMDISILILYLVASYWRLVYYNLIGTQNDQGRPYFSGITTIACAAVFYYLVSLPTFIPALNLKLLLYPFFILASIGMVSAIKFPKYGVVARVLLALGILTQLAHTLAVFM